MTRLSKLIFLLVLLPALLCFARGDYYKYASVDVSCNTGTDYVGDQATKTDGAANMAADKLYLALTIVVCTSGCSSGVLTTAHFWHDGTATDNMKLAVYSDDDDDTPDVGDLLLGYATLSTSSEEEVTAVMSGGEVTCGDKVWIMWVSDATTWDTKYDTGGTRYYVESQDYDNLPANLDLSWLSDAYTLEAWVTVGN